MLSELGFELGNARNQKGLSLEGVAGPAAISAAYLHKLERGVVNSPSPRVLARVALALEIPYLRLMELAGYLDEEQLAEARARALSNAPPARRAAADAGRVARGGCFHQSGGRPQTVSEHRDQVTATRGRSEPDASSWAQLLSAAARSRSTTLASSTT